MMGDYTWKRIDQIEVGDMIMSMLGFPVKVWQNKPVPLTKGRRMMSLTRASGDVLRFTDDHDLWYRNADGLERWGTHNYNWWLYEGEAYDEESDDPDMPYDYNNHDESSSIRVLTISGEKPIQVGIFLWEEYYDFATLDGFENLRAEYEDVQNPEEAVYGLYMREGGGYIVDGFVGFTQWANRAEFEGFRWQGITEYADAV